jgi:acyl-coenzyme A thioesterase PaaI-like protein
VQGGAICALLDAAAGYAGLYTPPGEPCVHGLTLSLTTNFLANGLGEVLTAKGYMDKKGGIVYFARAEIWLDDEVLLATAMGAFRYRRPVCAE